MSEHPGPVVSTRCGRVRGIAIDAGAAFLGIPYAAPPVGERRFQPPASPEPWTGVRSAEQYGPTPQRRPLAAVTIIPERSVPGEDTLNLNVFTPAAGDRQARLPVLVWIHGGGYMAGSAASPWFDGTRFARDGVVTVTVSYRLGFDGFGWIDGAPLNRGLLDQMAALRWVQDTIADFGGDPDRVTIAGQSAGGGSVLGLLDSPAAQDLFHRAVAHSGAPSPLLPAHARDAALRFAAEIGLDGTTLADWQTVTEQTLVERERDANVGPVYSPGTPVAELVDGLRQADPRFFALAFAPIVDGVGLLHPTEAVRVGLHAGRPLLLGTTAHEFDGHGPDEMAGTVAALQAAGVPAGALDRLAVDLGRRDGDLSRSHLTSMGVFRVPAARIAALRAGDAHPEAGQPAGAPTWLYDFRYLSGRNGLAGHCLELPFVWDGLDKRGVVEALGPDAPQELADRMHAVWVEFISTGTCDWPAADRGAAGAMVFDTAVRYDPEAYAVEAALVAGAAPGEAPAGV